MNKRRKYTTEFKEEAVKLITEQGYQVAEAARNLGINASILGRWKREVEGGGKGASGNGDLKAVKAEMNRLRKENKRLRLEREILKKAAAFFARESGWGINSLILQGRRIQQPCCARYCG